VGASEVLFVETASVEQSDRQSVAEREPRRWCLPSAQD